MATLPPGPIWLASYPKSGNTWMRILLANLLAKDEEPQNINALNLSDGVSADRTAIERELLVDTDLLTPSELARARAIAAQDERSHRDGPSIVKTHEAYELLDDGTAAMGRGKRAVLYLVRDPRDVAVSLAFHGGMSVDQAVETLCAWTPAGGGRHQVAHGWADWSRHASGWLGQNDLPVHLLRYEDLLADTPKAFAAALNFLGVDFGPDELARAVRHADFAELRRQEAATGFVERSPNATAPFFRQGRAGGWREYLNPAQQARLERAHRVMMARLGYLPAALDDEEDGL
ncbi:sulfotransferase domain-containing protein [Caulobacter sp. FWC2]|uniref:sulfotransferase domain-containing protein n=1 Tax=Caulobacter sp. FWC2 TaxID=69664 RepID=UPI000C152E36|nr:sulfotransferase domain-containing protein [Caulobacter sp. FWC2]PIB92138.1 sulfotransferase [Caulobacter sp. FWC2]